MKPEHTLPAQMQALAEQFDASFTCVVYDGDACLTSGAYGYADREAGRSLTMQDTFCFSLRARWLLALIALRLMEERKLRLTQKLSDYYPGYAQADRMTLLQLLRGRSGMPDYMTTVVRRGYDADPAYRDLPEDRRIVRERQDATSAPDAEAVLAMIGALPLAFEPDADYDEANRSEAALVAGVLEKASGLPLFALCSRYVFEPAGMRVQEGDVASTACMGRTQDNTPFPLPRPDALPLTYTADTDAFVRLGRVLADGGLLSAASWKLVRKYAAAAGSLGIDDVDGSLIVYDASVLGNSVRLFFGSEPRMLACYLMSEDQPACRIDGRREYLCPCIRQAWEGALQKLTAPRFVRLNRMNVWNALDLRVTPKQEDFVMLAPDAIAYCAVDRHWTPYLLVDGTRGIGLLVLNVDKRKGEYEIAIVLIDRRYQGRGYGRFMLEYAVDTLRKLGARKLKIGVNRENPAARHLYESLGFTAVRVYEGGVHLEMEVG